MTSKSECEQKLKFVRDSFWFSLGAYGLATKEPTSSFINQHRLIVFGDKIHVLVEGEKAPKGWLSYEVGFSAALDDGSAEAFVRQTFLYMILETFESAKKYAGHSGKVEDFKRQDWYPFARHLRNAIGHNGVWDIRGNPDDLPTKFRNKTIDKSLNGKKLNGFCDWVYGLQLCASIRSWVGSS
jgi:hypothetical protein